MDQSGLRQAVSFDTLGRGHAGGQPEAGPHGDDRTDVEAKVGLGQGRPHQSLHGVGRDAVPAGVDLCETELRGGVRLVGRKAEPAGGLNVVANDAPARVVPHA